MPTTPPFSPRIIVSACLLGHPVRYDGGHKFNQTVKDFLLQLEPFEIIPVCPETASGMPSPRPSQEFRGGTASEVIAGKASIVNEKGTDVTSEFLNGSLMEMVKCIETEPLPLLAILKSKSPACGHGKVYLDGKLTTGNGVFAELLERAGVKVISEEDLEANQEFYKNYILQKLENSPDNPA